MPHPNHKESVAALHREHILQAAEALFSEKGFDQTTIEDLSKRSEYSRRTIYAYYESKEDILHHIIEKGLITLKADLQSAISGEGDFQARCKAICAAMVKYQTECPHSLENVLKAKADSLQMQTPSQTVQSILRLGTEINALLEAFLLEGQAEGVLRPALLPMMTVYVLWSSLTAFITLMQTKGAFLCRQFQLSEDELYAYGFRQIANSILEERI